MTIRMSPAWTCWPSLKRISVMRPETSGRICAAFTAVSRPEKSDHTRIASGWTEATVTAGGGGGAAGGASPRPWVTAPRPRRRAAAIPPWTGCFLRKDNSLEFLVLAGAVWNASRRINSAIWDMRALQFCSACYKYRLALRLQDTYVAIATKKYHGRYAR